MKSSMEKKLVITIEKWAALIPTDSMQSYGHRGGLIKQLGFSP
jgi:hypothetical protein